MESSTYLAYRGRSNEDLFVVRESKANGALD